MLNVTIFASDDTMPSTLTGPMDVLGTTGLSWNLITGKLPQPLFRVHLATLSGDPVRCFNGLKIPPTHRCDTIHKTDIVLIPSLAVGPGGVHLPPSAAVWLQEMHDRGAVIASVCTGAFVLAAAGLLDGRRATTHWAFQDQLRVNHPEVRVMADRILVDEGSVITSGGGSAWHDLVLYLIERHVDRQAAIEAAKMFLLDRHIDTQAPYEWLCRPTPHRDAAILATQRWMERHFSRPDAVAGALQESGLVERTFNRRFRQATGLKPIAYVQFLRLEEAKRCLQMTTDSIENVALAVGYENPGSFRRLFKRNVGILPADYRRMFGARASGGADRRVLSPST